MKKLFFTALVAVVAVGGAYAQTYYDSIGNSYNCPAGPSTCDLRYNGANPDVSETFPQEEPIVPLSSIEAALPE